MFVLSFDCMPAVLPQFLQPEKHYELVIDFTLLK